MTLTSDVDYGYVIVQVHLPRSQFHDTYVGTKCAHHQLQYNTEQSQRHPFFTYRYSISDYHVL
jgi:hypothetical protein